MKPCLVSPRHSPSAARNHALCLQQETLLQMKPDRPLPRFGCWNSVFVSPPSGRDLARRQGFGDDSRRNAHSACLPRRPHCRGIQLSHRKPNYGHRLQDRKTPTGALEPLQDGRSGAKLPTRTAKQLGQDNGSPGVVRPAVPPSSGGCRPCQIPHVQLHSHYNGFLTT